MRRCNVCGDVMYAAMTPVAAEDMQTFPAEAPHRTCSTSPRAHTHTHTHTDTHTQTHTQTHTHIHNACMHTYMYTHTPNNQRNLFSNEFKLVLQRLETYFNLGLLIVEVLLH